MGARDMGYRGGDDYHGGVAVTARLTAYAPTDVVVDRLAAVAWGPLGGRAWQGVRSTLHALVMVADRRTGVTTTGTTAHQLAERAGLSERWTRVCLQTLEELGVIEWTRGGVAHGAPQPSLMRIVKRVLVDWVHAWRPTHDRAILDYRARTRARLARVRHRFLRSRKSTPQRCRSRHAALGAGLSPLRGTPSRGASPRNRHSQPRKEPPMIEYQDTLMDDGRASARQGETAESLRRRADERRAAARHVDVEAQTKRRELVDAWKQARKMRKAARAEPYRSPHLGGEVPGMVWP